MSGHAFRTSIFPRPRTAKASAGEPTRWMIERLEPRVLLSADPLGQGGSLDSADPDFDAGAEGDQLLKQWLDQGLATDSSPPLPEPIEALDLDALAAADGESWATSPAETTALDELASALGSDPAGTADRTELIIVDSRVPDAQTLLTGLREAPDTQYHVIAIDGEREGLAEVTARIAAFSDIDAIHLLAHGGPDRLQIGASTLTSDNVSDYGNVLNSWRSALDDDADLLLYGCELAGNSAGQALLGAIADATGADVAASDDLTGATGSGGDWHLEHQLGAIDTELAFAAAQRSQWQGVLALGNYTGEVTVSGLPRENQLLSVSDTLADPDGPAPLDISYHWFRGSTDTGLTGNYYILGDLDVGHAISVEARYTDGSGGDEVVSSAASDPVANVNDPHTGSVWITGTPEEDSTLTVAHDLADADGLDPANIVFTWFRNGSDTGITGTSYRLGDADVGTAISVQAVYTDDQGTKEMPRVSAETIAIANVNDDPAGDVTLSQTTGVAQGDTLTVSDTLTDADGPDPLAVTYHWFRNGTEPVATGASYTLTQADVGAALHVEARYTDADGKDETKISAATDPVIYVNDVATGTVLIEGEAKEDQRLRARVADLVDEDGVGDLTAQWYRNNDSIEGATGRDYTLTQADVGQQIRVEVSFLDDLGSQESLVSEATAAVENINDPVTGQLALPQRSPFGSTLVLALDELEDEDGLSPPFLVEWFADGRLVASGSAPSYTPDGAMIGAHVHAVVSFRDDQGQWESVQSSATRIEAYPPGSQPLPSAPSTPESPPQPGPNPEGGTTQGSGEGEGSTASQQDAEEADPVTHALPGDELSNGTPTLAGGSRPADLFALWSDWQGPRTPIDTLRTSLETSTDDAGTGPVSVLHLRDIGFAATPSSTASSLQALLHSADVELVTNETFDRELAAMRDDIIYDAGLSQAMIGGSMAVSTGLSVGYAAWLARSGVILSSVLSSLPAWRLIDPLPVLQNLLDQSSESDDESLESLVDTQPTADQGAVEAINDSEHSEHAHELE